MDLSGCIVICRILAVVGSRFFHDESLWRTRDGRIVCDRIRCGWLFLLWIVRNLSCCCCAERIDPAVCGCVHPTPQTEADAAPKRAGCVKLRKRSGQGASPSRSFFLVRTLQSIELGRGRGRRKIEGNGRRGSGHRIDSDTRIRYTGRRIYRRYGRRYTGVHGRTVRE